MTDIKSQILSEVEESLGSHAVMVVADAMEKCPTLANILSRVDATTRGDLVISHPVIGGILYPDRTCGGAFGNDNTDEIEIFTTIDTDGDGVSISFESPVCIPAGAPMVIRDGKIEPAGLRSLEGEVFIKGDE